MAQKKGSKNKKTAELNLEDVLWNCRDILHGDAARHDSYARFLEIHRREVLSAA